MRTTIGGPATRGRRRMAEAPAIVPAAAPPAPVTGAGVTPTSPSLTLPASDRASPAGPHGDAIDRTCLSCHSAGMVLTRPRLNRAEWQGEVDRMVKVREAPLDPADATLIVAYLAALESGR